MTELTTCGAALGKLPESLVGPIRVQASFPCCNYMPQCPLNLFSEGLVAPTVILNGEGMSNRLIGYMLRLVCSSKGGDKGVSATNINALAVKHLNPQSGMLEVILPVGVGGLGESKVWIDPKVFSQLSAKQFFSQLSAKQLGVIQAQFKSLIAVRDLLSGPASGLLESGPAIDHVKTSSDLLLNHPMELLKLFLTVPNGLGNLGENKFISVGMNARAAQLDCPEEAKDPMKLLEHAVSHLYKCYLGSKDVSDASSEVSPIKPPLSRRLVEEVTASEQPGSSEGLTTARAVQPAAVRAAPQQQQPEGPSAGVAAVARTARTARTARAAQPAAVQPAAVVAPPPPTPPSISSRISSVITFPFKLVASAFEIGISAVIFMSLWVLSCLWGAGVWISQRVPGTGSGDNA